MLKTLRNIHSRAFADGIGMASWLPQLPDPSESWVIMEQDIWDVAWKLNVELASARLGWLTSGTSLQVLNNATC